MAEFLKLQFGLTSLKVALTGSGQDTGVQLDLQRSGGGETRTTSGLRLGPEEFGLPSRLEARAERAGKYSFRLPESVGVKLSEFLQDHPAGSPLWIHLVQPYGFLAALPWEGILANHVRGPVLRLPDFIFESPNRARSRLDVAICASVPRAKAMFDAEDYIGRLLDSYSKVEARAVTIHLFTDQDVFQGLREVREGPGGIEVRVYDPQETDSFPGSHEAREDSSRSTRSGGITSPWLQWMLKSRKKSSFDAVHFVCHGYLSTNKGYLALAESPTLNKDRRSARFVGSAELNTFLNRVGAWATGFTSPDHNYSALGLRLLADAMVRTRPGPMLCQEGVRGEDWETLGGLLAFLFSREASTPPQAPGFFVSCQPSLVRGLADGSMSDDRGKVKARGGRFPSILFPSRRVGSGPGREDSFQFEGEDAPGWLSTAARYIEQRRWRIDSERRHADTVPISKARRAELEATEEALKKLEQMIHGWKSPGSPHGKRSGEEATQ
jgi:hypothetical protein